MHIRALALSILSMLIVCAAPAGAGMELNRQGYVQQFRQMMEQLVQADNVMHERMKIISQNLLAYYLRHGHLPTEGPQQDKWKAAFEAQMPQNPYHPRSTELYYGMKLDDENKIKVFFLNNVTLSIETAREYHKSAPQGWTAEPGTIMVMIDNEGRYLIWAASADRRPLRDYEHNDKTRLIYRDCTAVRQ